MNAIQVDNYKNATHKVTLDWPLRTVSKDYIIIVSLTYT